MHPSGDKKSHGSILGILSCPYARKLLLSFAGFMLSSWSFMKLLQLKNDSNESTNKTSSSKSTTLYRVVFVLGGPGSGKGTQCAKIIADRPSWSHLSAGDLLRAERKKSDSELANVINSCIQAGKIVPSEITARLLYNAMEDICAKGGKGDFLIDGFPRSTENVQAWDTLVGQKANLAFVLYLDCPEDVMTGRLLDRKRGDDNLETIRKRFQTATTESMPVVHMYRTRGLLKTVSADQSVDDVYKQVSALLDQI